MVSSYNKKIFIFDIDNTICVTKKNFYKSAKPKKKIIDFINSLKQKGHIIKIYTSRYMGRTNQNVRLVNKKYKKQTIKQLQSWGLQFDEVIMGKPSYDFFIDDKSFNPKNINIKNTFKKFII